MNPMLIQVISVVVAVVVTALIAVPIAGKLAVARKNREDQEKVGTAEEKARGIIDEAIKTAETKKREVLLEAKEENLKLKNKHYGKIIRNRITYRKEIQNRKCYIAFINKRPYSGKNIQIVHKNI